MEELATWPYAVLELTEGKRSAVASPNELHDDSSARDCVGRPAC